MRKARWERRLASRRQDFSHRSWKNALVVRKGSATGVFELVLTREIGSRSACRSSRRSTASGAHFTAAHRSNFFFDRACAGRPRRARSRKVVNSVSLTRPPPVRGAARPRPQVISRKADILCVKFMFPNTFCGGPQPGGKLVSGFLATQIPAFSPGSLAVANAQGAIL